MARLSTMLEGMVSETEGQVKPGIDSGSLNNRGIRPYSLSQSCLPRSVISSRALGDDYISVERGGPEPHRVVVVQHQVFHRFVGVFTELAVRQPVWRKADPGWAVCGLPAPSSTAFAHQYRRLDIDELPGVLGHYWHQGESRSTPTTTTSTPSPRSSAPPAATPGSSNDSWPRSPRSSRSTSSTPSP
jgi:hypothetical protein